MLSTYFIHGACTHIIRTHVAGGGTMYSSKLLVFLVPSLWNINTVMSCVCEGIS